MASLRKQINDCAPLDIFPSPGPDGRDKPTNVRGISIFCPCLSLLAFLMSELVWIWNILSLLDGLSRSQTLLLGFVCPHCCGLLRRITLLLLEQIPGFLQHLFRPCRAQIICELPNLRDNLLELNRRDSPN